VQKYLHDLPRWDALTTEAQERIIGRTKLSNVELDDAFVRAHAGTHAGAHVLLTVSDTGVGMSAETRTRVFEPFFTTKERSRGTGLGLATVYGIVTQAGGHIWVDSEPGRGTTFTIYLPRTDVPVEAATDAASARAPAGREAILVVEDDDAVRKVTSDALRSFGYDVHAVADAESALALVEQQLDAYDLILSDIVLSGMSGPQLAERLGERRPGLRILFMSGYADDAIAGIAPSGIPLIQKPFMGDALARKVRETLDAHPTDR